MTIGVVFEQTVGNELWKIEYEVKVQCGHRRAENIGFVSETLTAKNPSATGPATTYIKREDKKLEILPLNKDNREKYPISRNNPSLQAIRSLHPDFEGLPSELKMFVEAIERISDTHIFAISPRGVRDAVNSEKPIKGLGISSFDLLPIIDEIKKQGKHYELFKEAFCDILELEEISFEVHAFPIQIQSKEAEPKEKLKQYRFFFIKRKGDVPSPIEEYSDGTFAVASILGILLSEKMKDPILLIEEPENYLHPAALAKLLRFLRSHVDKKPVLITTHSPYLLNGVNPEDVSVAVIDEAGGTHFEKIKNNKQLRDYLRSGLMSFGDLLSSNFEEVLGSK
jgi:hypothetical protein